MIQRLKDNYRAVLTTLGLILPLAILLYMGWVLIMPLSYWFEYTDVSSLRKNYAHKDLLTMNSTRNISRKTNVEWIDVLKCDFGEGFVFYSSQVTQGTILRGGESSTWIYGADAPTKDSVCYVESTITAELDFHIQKSQVIRSNDFNIE